MIQELPPLAKPLLTLVLTIGFGLTRPQVGSLKVNIGVAACIGALMALLMGTVTWQQTLTTLKQLSQPLATITSLMVMTQVAARIGLIHRLSDLITVRANGDAQRLFSYLFWSGTVVGAFFTNDAAILLLTPMVLVMTDTVGAKKWSRENQAPYYFAVLYTGNMVGAMVISNPINIIAAGFYQIDFFEYLEWMALPAAVSMVTTWWGLRFAFRQQLPRKYDVQSRSALKKSPHQSLFWATLLIIAATLLGFLTEPLSGIPTAAISIAGAMTLLAMLGVKKIPIMPVLLRIDWQILVFVSGIMIVTVGLRNAGITAMFADLLHLAIEKGFAFSLVTTSLLSALSSAFINNHSTVGIMIWVIRDLHLDVLESKLMVYAALIGGDLGPKMLPIGSLAALMWFRMMRHRGISVSIAQYISLGVPITVSAVLASAATLILQWWLFTV